MFEWCSTNISGITYFYVDQETIDAKRDVLEARFAKCEAIKGCRKQHSFTPNGRLMRVKRFSADSHFVDVDCKGE